MLVVTAWANGEKKSIISIRPYKRFLVVSILPPHGSEWQNLGLKTSRGGGWVVKG